MRFIYLLFLLPFTASAQCDPEGILLELQATTDLNGLLFGETGCIEAVTIGSPLTFTGGTLDITTGNLTAGSTKVAVTGGTGAVIGSGSTVDVVPGNILLSTLGGSLNLSQIAQGGATTNQLLQWNGTTWTPATISSGSGTVTSVALSLPSIFSVSGSPVTTSGTLTGALATQSANTVFAGPTTGGAATPAFRALVAADLPSGTNLWTDAGATTYLTSTGDNVAIGSTSATQKLDVTGSIKGSADLYLGSSFKVYDNGSLIWHRSGSFKSLFTGNAVGTTSNTGNRNFGFGENLFQALTSGEQNVAIGGTVLYGLTTGSANVGIGINVMQNLTTGNSNMSIGGSSGSALTTGLGNCLIGSGSGGGLTTGSYNMAIGTNALRTATTQGYNAAIGFQALYTNSPSFSVAIGSEAGYGGANRLNGVYLGSYAGYSATGATQVAIGYGAGFGNTIDQTLAIDYNPGFTSDATPLISGNFSTDRLGINTAHASLAQTLHVTGTARITGSDGTATTLMGRDADGDISALSLSGMSISAGTLTATDPSLSNEGVLGVGTGSGTSSTLLSTTSGANAVTINAAGILAIAESTSSNGGSITLTATEVDGSTTNELQTLSVSTNTTTLSNSGGSMTIAGGGINTVGTAGTTITITGTEVDGSISNEGSLTVGAGSGTTSIINSNTSGSTGVTITAGSGLTISETGNVITLANSAPDQTVSITGAGINAVTGTYPNFTITGTEVDGSVTNEAQTLSTSGTTSGILTLSTAGGAGGGTATIAAGTGITVAQSAGTITITNSSPATAGWLLDGNTIGSAKRIGSNDNFDVVVETNGTDRMWFDNAGTVSIGATQLTTAQLNISTLGATNTGMLISGGGSLVGPTFYSATGSGSGSTATVLSGVLAMTSGNVEALMKNTTTGGTNGGAVFTANVSPTATSNDPFFKWSIEGVTDWSMGIDNDDVDNLKLHRFSRPSDNNGVGTIEFGYDGSPIGVAINKTGIGTSANNFYAIDAFGKFRADQYTNNTSGVVTTGTIALGNAAGTGPTFDAALSKFWGNGARIKFLSGSSPTANGVICTITLDTEYTFGECAPIMQGRTTNAGAFNYSCNYNSATRVITCTLVGTLTAATQYEFNLILSGMN